MLPDQSLNHFEVPSQSGLSEWRSDDLAQLRVILEVACHNRIAEELCLRVAVVVRENLSGVPEHPPIRSRARHHHSAPTKWKREFEDAAVEVGHVAGVARIVLRKSCSVARQPIRLGTRQVIDRL